MSRSGDPAWATTTNATRHSLHQLAYTQQLSISTSVANSLLPSASHNTPSVQAVSSSSSQPISFLPPSSRNPLQHPPTGHTQPRIDTPFDTVLVIPNSQTVFAPTTPSAKQPHPLPTPQLPFTPESSESSRGLPPYTPYQFIAFQIPGASGPLGPPFTPTTTDSLQTPISAGPSELLIHRSQLPTTYFSRWYRSGSSTPTGPNSYGYQSMVQRPAEPILAPGEEPAQRPPACYAALIAEALLLADPPHQLLVSEISESIKSRYVCE